MQIWGWVGREGGGGLTTRDLGEVSASELAWALGEEGLGEKVHRSGLHRALTEETAPARPFPLLAVGSEG